MSKPVQKCSVCGRNPERMNSYFSECSHVECPTRRHAWSERPSRQELFKGPWPVNVDADPKPLGEDGYETDAAGTFKG